LPLTNTAPAVTAWEAYGTNPSTGAPYGGMSIGGEASDAQISVSTTHVVVTARDALGFYTKSGLKVFGVVDGLSFFTAAGVTNNGSNWEPFDLRTVYDAYRNRFVITMLYADFTTGTGSELLMAVSKGSDPTQGFWVYTIDDPVHWATGWSSGDVADYDCLGVGPTTYLVSANWNLSAAKGVQIMMFDASAMSSGQAYSWWVFYNWSNPDSSKLYVVQPAVHHGSTGSANTVWFVEKWGNHAEMFYVDNPLQGNQASYLWDRSLTGTSSGLVNGPQKGVTVPTPPPIAMGPQVNDIFLKAVWRSNKLYLSANNSINSGGIDYSAGRVIRINVTSAYGTIEIDRTFGLSSPGDPPGLNYYYGWPGMEVNSSGDMAILSSRTNSSIFPELRLSQWLHIDSDIEGSVLLKAGEAPYQEGTAWCGSYECWGETTGETVDPSDDTSIWVTQEYPVPVPRGFNNTYDNHSMWVAQAFGSGCGHSVCTVGNHIPASCDSICVAPLCTHDPYCCTYSWDATCVSEVPTYCGHLCTGVSP